MWTRVAIWLLLTVAGCTHAEVSQQPPRSDRSQNAVQAVETAPWYANNPSNHATASALTRAPSPVAPADASLPKGSLRDQYFSKVKEVVGIYWDPKSALLQRDPSGKLFGGPNRYTLLSIALDSEGRLVDAHVRKSSGIDIVDDAAVLAFRRSALPRPPPEVLKEGKVEFEFGFFLDFGDIQKNPFRTNADDWKPVSTGEGENWNSPQPK